MTKAAATLRAEFEAAVLAEVERTGPGGFRRDTVIKPFLERGAKQSTLYRWTAEILKSGKPGQHVARQVKAAAAARAARSADPSAEVAQEVAARLPVVARVEDIVTGGSTVKVIEKLDYVIKNLDLLIAHAKTEDGKVRNARLLLSATDRMRAALGTATKLYQAMREVNQVDRLHEAIIRRIRELSPVTAEAILRDIDQIAAQWGG